MHKYMYDGPVMIFDTCVNNHWKAETMAVSEKKAKSNLAYQYKKRTNITRDTKVTLPGKIKMID